MKLQLAACGSENAPPRRDGCLHITSGTNSTSRKALLRSLRLFNAFRKCDDGVWRFTHNRTENVFIAPLPAGWASDYPTRSILMTP